MSSAKITLFSFARWMQQSGDDLFSNMTVPTGIEKDVLVDNILLRGGEFEVVYSDPNFMQYAIGTWSRKWYRTMQKWIDALSIEYAPLENYDRHEQWSDITDRNTGSSGVSGSEKTNTDTSDNVHTIDNVDVRTNDNTDTRTHDNTDERIHDNVDQRTHDNTDKTTHADTDTRTNANKDQRTHDYVDQTIIHSDISDDIDEDDVKTSEVSAFDSTGWQNATKDTMSHDGDNKRTEDTDNIASHAGTITDDHTGTITDAHTGTITDDHTGTITDAHSGTITDAHTGTITDDHTGTITDAHAGTLTDNHSGSGSENFDETHADNGFEDIDFEHTGRVHGNIGVTTSQQMLQQELDIAQWNIYEHITDLFLNEFVIPIYT